MIALLGAGLVAAAALLARVLGARRIPELVLACWLIASSAVVALMQALSAMGAARYAPVTLATLAGIGGLGGAALWIAGPRVALCELSRLLPALASSVRRRARRSWLAPLALALGAAVLAHALCATWLLPSESWDGVWYHDTITGWVVQTGSASPMPLPHNLLQQVNGFPRGAELTSAWLAILSGRALIELPNTLALLPLASASYLLSARLTRTRGVALALACAASLAPGVVLQLSSTYVDVYAAAAALSSLWLATKAPLTPRDAVLAGLAVGLHLSCKSTAPLLAPLVLGALLLRLWRGEGGAWQGRVASALIACLAPLLAVASVYGKNAAWHHNPLYPIDVQLPRLGVSWPGVRAAEAVDVNVPAGELLASVFAPPTPGRDFADIRSGGYGLAVAWVVLPLAALGVARALARLRARRPCDRGRARAALWPLALSAPSLALSPALWAARYNLHAIAVLAALAVYALDGLTRRAARELLPLAAMGLTALAIARFDPPLGEAPLARLTAAVAMPPEERAAQTRAEWTIEPAVARARERELTTGTLAVFGPGISFPSLLYNERFDNRVAYVDARDERAVEAALAALEPTWLAASAGEPLHEHALRHPETWQPIGLLSRGHPTTAFRRLARGLDR